MSVLMAGLILRFIAILILVLRVIPNQINDFRRDNKELNGFRLIFFLSAIIFLIGTIAFFWLDFAALCLVVIDHIFGLCHQIDFTTAAWLRIGLNFVGALLFDAAYHYGSKRRS